MRKPLPERVERLRIVGRLQSKSGDCYGAFEIPGPCGERLSVIASDGSDRVRWEHVSVSVRKRNPNWQEMNFIKQLFWNDDECVVQFHPAQASYVNIHPHTLHLWRPLDVEMPTPPRIAV